MNLKILIVERLLPPSGKLRGLISLIMICVVGYLMIIGKADGVALGIVATVMASYGLVQGVQAVTNRGQNYPPATAPGIYEPTEEDRERQRSREELWRKQELVDFEMSKLDLAEKKTQLAARQAANELVSRLKEQKPAELRETGGVGFSEPFGNVPLEREV